MAPFILAGGPGGDGGGGDGSGLKRLDLQPAPPAIYGEPPSDVDVAASEEEGEDMASTAERLSALEHKQDGLLDLGHKLELGQEKAEGARALQGQQIAALVAEVAKIPAIETKVTECSQNTAQILVILQGAGMVPPGGPPTGTPTVAGASSGSAQLMHWLMPAIRQLPPQVILLIAAYLLFTGKISL